MSSTVRPALSRSMASHTMSALSGSRSAVGSSRITSAASRRNARASAIRRRSQIGSGERAEKIRTYNFPESRVTDHRVKLTAHRLDQVLEGQLDEFTDELRADERRRALAAASA